VNLSLRDFLPVSQKDLFFGLFSIGKAYFFLFFLLLLLLLLLLLQERLSLVTLSLYWKLQTSICETAGIGTAPQQYHSSYVVDSVRWSICPSI